MQQLITVAAERLEQDLDVGTELEVDAGALRSGQDVCLDLLRAAGRGQVGQQIQAGIALRRGLRPDLEQPVESIRAPPGGCRQDARADIALQREGIAWSIGLPPRLSGQRGDPLQIALGDRIPGQLLGGPPAGGPALRQLRGLGRRGSAQQLNKMARDRVRASTPDRGGRSRRGPPAADPGVRSGSANPPRAGRTRRSVRRP